MARKDPISHLGRHHRPPPRLIQEILSLGRPGLERLVAMVSDRARWADAPVAVANAAVVLGEARDPIGLPCLVAVHAEAEFDSDLYASAGYALSCLIGPDNYGPLLSADLDDQRRDDATAILVDAGVRDPALVPALESLVRREPEVGAQLCATYCDPALAPALLAAFDERLEAGAEDPEQLESASDLLRALEALEGWDEARASRLRLAMLEASSRLRDEIYELESEIAHELGLTRMRSPGLGPSR